MAKVIIDAVDLIDRPLGGSRFRIHPRPGEGSVDDGSLVSGKFYSGVLDANGKAEIEDVARNRVGEYYTLQIFGAGEWNFRVARDIDVNLASWLLANQDPAASGRNDTGGGNFVPVPGSDGEDGDQWFFGTTDPGTIEGQKVGDFYLNSDNGDIWRYDGSAWVKLGTFKGDPGDDGTDGKDGRDGTNGRRGSIWFHGNGAPGTIASAIAFDLYLDGTNSDVYRYDGSSWNKIENIRGAVGRRGSLWYRDSGAPDNETAKDDRLALDWYIDTDTGDAYRFGSNRWTKELSLKGPKGDPAPAAPFKLVEFAKLTVAADATFSTFRTLKAAADVPDVFCYQLQDTHNRLDLLHWFLKSEIPTSGTRIFQPGDPFAGVNISLRITNGNLEVAAGGTSSWRGNMVHALYEPQASGATGPRGPKGEDGKPGTSDIAESFRDRVDALDQRTSDLTPPSTATGWQTLALSQGGLSIRNGQPTSTAQVSGLVYTQFAQNPGGQHLVVRIKPAQIPNAGQHRVLFENSNGSLTYSQLLSSMRLLSQSANWAYYVDSQGRAIGSDVARVTLQSTASDSHIGSSTYVGNLDRQKVYEQVKAIIVGGIDDDAAETITLGGTTVAAYDGMAVDADLTGITIGSTNYEIVDLVVRGKEEGLTNRVTALMDHVADVVAGDVSTGWTNVNSNTVAGIAVSGSRITAGNATSQTYVGINVGTSTNLSYWAVRIPIGDPVEQYRLRITGVDSGEVYNLLCSQMTELATDSNWRYLNQAPALGSRVRNITMQLTASNAHVGSSTYLGNLNREKVYEQVKAIFSGVTADDSNDTITVAGFGPTAVVSNVNVGSTESDILNSTQWAGLSDWFVVEFDGGSGNRARYETMTIRKGRVGTGVDNVRIHHGGVASSYLGLRVRNNRLTAKATSIPSCRVSIYSV